MLDYFNFKIIVLQSYHVFFEGLVSGKSFNNSDLLNPSIFCTNNSKQMEHFIIYYFYYLTFK